MERGVLGECSNNSIILIVQTRSEVLDHPSLSWQPDSWVPALDPVLDGLGMLSSLHLLY